MNIKNVMGVKDFRFVLILLYSWVSGLAFAIGILELTDYWVSYLNTIQGIVYLVVCLLTLFLGACHLCDFVCDAQNPEPRGTKTLLR